MAIKVDKGFGIFKTKNLKFVLIVVFACQIALLDYSGKFVAYGIIKNKKKCTKTKKICLKDTFLYSAKISSQICVQLLQECSSQDRPAPNDREDQGFPGLSA